MVRENHPWPESSCDADSPLGQQQQHHEEEAQVLREQRMLLEAARRAEDTWSRCAELAPCAAPQVGSGNTSGARMVTPGTQAKRTAPCVARIPHVGVEESQVVGPRVARGRPSMAKAWPRMARAMAQWASRRETWPRVA
ncbi:hypothetical protein GUJ93_ZPchr0010g8979 [Zizania palustris]|uniref:Uncharacterized protein n=1 Tax=Zizania palustris TaxID=103762 RepID=A0A8J6BMP3_ZIZPA|nr:hypothetical protein GUJ93_ZPchr0010g8979 [Zizania palustris]